MSSITTTKQFIDARNQLGNQLANVLNSFGITLPTPDATGVISASSLNSTLSTTAAAYPAGQFTAAIQATIKDILTSMGLLATLVMPWFQTGIANLSGSTNATVTTAVTFPSNATGPAAYAVFVDPGQACTVVVSSKTTSGFSVAMTPPASGAISAGTFGVAVFG